MIFQSGESANAHSPRPDKAGRTRLETGQTEQGLEDLDKQAFARQVDEMEAARARLERVLNDTTKRAYAMIGREDAPIDERGNA